MKTYQLSFVKEKDIQARFLEPGDFFSLSDGGSPRVVTSVMKNHLYYRSLFTGKLDRIMRTSACVIKLTNKR